jgi:hypothetical protein
MPARSSTRSAFSLPSIWKYYVASRLARLTPAQHTEPTRCHADLTAEAGRQMALVGRPGFLRDQSERLVVRRSKVFARSKNYRSPCWPISLASAPITEMRLDIVAHAPQPLAGQPVRWRQGDRRRIDKAPHYLHRWRRIQRIDEASNQGNRNVISGEVPNRIMLVDASDVWPGRCPTGAAASWCRRRCR